MAGTPWGPWNLRLGIAELTKEENTVRRAARAGGKIDHCGLEIQGRVGMCVPAGVLLSTVPAFHHPRNPAQRLRAEGAGAAACVLGVS